MTVSLLGIAVFVAFLFSVIAHEVAHGWVADRCGDPTARWAGRLTANPIPHLDPWMSIGFPLLTLWVSGGSFVFGSAKPVPVQERNLRSYPRDAILVALAGIATNLVIATGCSAVFHLLLAAAPGLAEGFLGSLLVSTALTNVLLAVFNLIPIPPLDGSRVFRFVLDPGLRRAYMEIERYGFLVLVVLLQLPFVNDAIWQAQLFVARVLHLPVHGAGFGA